MIILINKCQTNYTQQSINHSLFYLAREYRLYAIYPLLTQTSRTTAPARHATVFLYIIKRASIEKCQKNKSTGVK
jgi:hypothetical protein